MQKRSPLLEISTPPSVCTVFFENSASSSDISFSAASVLSLIHIYGSEFISSFIETIGKHGCTIDELLQQFHRYSDHVHVERTTHGEFDYLVYFEDGVPDDYRYCITDEGCHLIYHRFTPEDYEDFQF